MSAIDKLVMQTLGKMLPPEIQAHLASPEGLQKSVQDAAREYGWWKQAIAFVVQQNAAILANQQVMMGALNVGTDYSSGPKLGGGDDSADGNSDARAA